MKKKLSLLVAVFSVIALVSPSLALALEVDITPQGTIIFYQGAVLGDSVESGASSNRSARSNTVERASNRQEIKRVTGSTKEVRVMPTKIEPSRSDSGSGRMEAGRTEPGRPQTEKNFTVSVEEKKRMEEARKPELKDSRDGKKEMPKTEEKQEFIKTEQVETDDVKVQFPAELRMAKPEPRSMQPSVMPTEPPASSGMPSSIEARIKEYQEKLRTERSEVKDKMVEIRNEAKEDRQELKLKADEIKAKVEAGAGFVVDSETNEVKVVTPSGEEKILNHLPDQAIQRMQERGLLQAGQGTTSDLEPTITTGEDGSVKYTLPITKEKRLFGLFKRQVPAEVELDDATGEVVEREQAPKTPLQRFLKIFEF